MMRALARGVAQQDHDAAIRETRGNAHETGELE
jgi:hypothetical protein